MRKHLLPHVVNGQPSGAYRLMYGPTNIFTGALPSEAPAAMSAAAWSQATKKSKKPDSAWAWSGF